MSKLKKEKLIGYSISGPDNYGYMNYDQYEVNICDCIDYVRNRRLHVSPNFKMKKAQYDFSFTFDSYLIVSDRFKDFCTKNNYEGINFYPLNNYPKRFFMDILNVKRFDTIRKAKHLEYIEFNPRCNEYNEVVGPNPLCLVDNEALTDGFFRTDLEFGRSYAKGPEYLVGIETWKKMRMETFKGLYTSEILTKYDWEENL